MKLWDRIPENKKNIVSNQEHKNLDTEIENNNVITTCNDSYNYNQIENNSVNIDTDSAEVPKEPHFIEIYLNDIVLLKNLPSSCSSILYELIKLTTWDNKIVLNSSIKKNIIKTLDIKMSTLNNTLSQFVKEKILYRLDIGIYMPNPYLLVNGDFSNVDQLRLVIDYTPKVGKRNIRLEVNGELVE